MEKRILCYGDSNTWGAIPLEDGRYPKHIRFTGVLQNELGREYEIIEEGYNGRTTVFEDSIENRLSGIRYFGPCCASQSPLDLIVLMLGTNDLKLQFGVNAGTIAFGLQRYLDVLDITAMAGPKPQLLLVSPVLIDPSYRKHPLHYALFGEEGTERSKELSHFYEAFARKAGIFFLDAALYGKASELDGLHMDPDSHAKLGKAIAGKIKEILKQEVF